MIDCELPDEERLESILLGIWYRARHSPGYRRKIEKTIGAGIDPETGLEASEADLLPSSMAIRGPAFVMECPVQPDRLAEDTLLREEADGSTPSLSQCQALGLICKLPDLEHPGTFSEIEVMRAPLHERGRVEEELLYLAKQNPGREYKIRTLQGREAWTDSEAEAMAELTFRYQKLLLKFAERGWVRLEPPVKFTSVGIGADPGRDAGYASGVDDKGLPYIATVTPEGVDEAERRIAGDPLYAKGAFSIVAAMSGSQKAAVATRNSWASRKYLREDGAGV